MKLLLFDIDGTLLLSTSGLRAVVDAIRALYDPEADLEGIELAGRTDALIASQILTRYGREVTPESITEFVDQYLQQLAAHLPEETGTLLPGINPLLDALHDREDVALGLLTGNMKRGAHLKLQSFKLGHYFEFGAFADDHHDRNALGPFAMERANARHQRAFALEETFVIGDTPHDIACARAFGAKAVGVATGKFTVEELTACHADWVFADLSDVSAVLEAVGIHEPTPAA